MSEKVIPNLFVIGAQKAGTTSLYYYLKNHPDIFLTEKKELHFFSSTDKVLDFDEYHEHFKGSEDYKLRGEISPSYLHVKGTAKRIFDFNRDAKIIMILRDPVTRAFSNYIHRYRVGREIESDFEQALINNKESLRANNYLAKGLYCEQVDEYLQHFDSKNILILKYEEFQSDNSATLNAIQEFLDIEVRNLTVEYKHNTATLPRYGVLKPLFRLYSSRFAPFIKKWIPQKYLQKVKKKLTVPTEKLSNQKRLELCEKYFKSDIDKLEKLVKMDFSNWYSKK